MGLDNNASGKYIPTSPHITSKIDKQRGLFQIKVDISLAGASLSMIKVVKTLRVQLTGTDKWGGGAGIYYRRHLQIQLWLGVGGEELIQAVSSDFCSDFWDRASWIYKRNGRLNQSRMVQNWLKGATYLFALFGGIANKPERCRLAELLNRYTGLLEGALHQVDNGVCWAAIASGDGCNRRS